LVGYANKSLKQFQNGVGETFSAGELVGNWVCLAGGVNFSHKIELETLEAWLAESLDY
jgi:hypothetical protein